LGDDVVWIPGGTFSMRSANFYPEEGPVHDVTVDGFWMDRDEVTNEQFARFVTATGYVTVAKRPLKPEDFPGAPAENLVPDSMVFQKRTGPVDLRNSSNWWAWVPGAIQRVLKVRSKA
jgi:sulfatase modifying factor 1